MNFKNPNNFRYVVTFSLLFGKNITVENDEPFENYELTFLDLVGLISKGSKIYLSNKNRTLHLKPGVIELDQSQDHSFCCQETRSIVYYLEPLILLGLYSRQSLQITLEGITNDSVDLSVDAVKDALFPILKACYNDSFAAEIKIVQRGFRPTAGGKVFFSINSIRYSLSSLSLKPQKVLIKRIRGTVISSKTSAQFLNRMISRTREILNDYIPDVWVYSVLVKNSPDNFYGICLHTNNFLVAESSYDRVIEGENIKSPEQVAEESCSQLLDEIRFASSLVSTSFQGLLLVLMALGKGVSSCPMGRLSEHSVWILRLIKAFCGVKFEFENLIADDQEAQEVLAKCAGVGLANRTTELN